jgi:hypothetical protein
MGLIFGFIGSLAALLFLRNLLNRLLYRVLARITGSNRIATLLYALLFLPGVALHEASHWITAKLMGVGTYRFSLTPEWIGAETLRFGYVELSETDKIRSALIGLAPIVTGTALITWLGFHHLKLDIVVEGLQMADLDRAMEGVKAFLATPDIFLWSFLAFAISNTMLPSSSDRQAWLPFILFLGIIALLILFLDLGMIADWLSTQLKQLIEAGVKVIGLSVFLNLIVLLPISLLNRVLK